MGKNLGKDGRQKEVFFCKLACEGEELQDPYLVGDTTLGSGGLSLE